MLSDGAVSEQLFLTWFGLLTRLYEVVHDFESLRLLSRRFESGYSLLNY